MNKKAIISLSIIAITSISSNAFSKSAQSYLNEGIKYLESSNLDKAEKSLKTAIKLNKNLYIAYSKLGNVYLERGDNNTAISYYNKALKINPKYSNAYNNLGSAYANMEQNEKALGYFNQALKLDPKDETVLNNISKLKEMIIQKFESDALSQIEEGSYNNAIKIYNNLLKKDPNSSKYNAEIASCYIRMNNLEQANNYLQKSLKLDKNNTLANFYMGQIYIQKIKNEKSPNDHVAEIEGYMKEAQNYFDNACNSGLEESCQNMEVQILKSSLRIGFTPYELETIDSLYNEGLNFYNQKRYDDAIPPLEEANKLDPRNTKIARLTLTAKKEKGLDLIKKGKKEEGEKIVEEVEFLTSFLEFAEISNEEKLLKEVSSEIEKNNFKAVIDKLEGVKSKYAEIQERIDFALLMSYSNGIEKFFKENDFDGAKKQIDKIDSILKETKLSNEFTKPAKLSVIFFSKIISIKEAYYLLEEDKYKEAEIALNKILEKEPNNSSAYSSLAYVKSKTGEIDKGIELAKKSIELDPKDPFNYYDLASIYLDKNDKVNAISNLKQSIKIEPVFKDYLKTSKDKDMDKIRNSKEFKELIK